MRFAATAADTASLRCTATTTALRGVTASEWPFFFESVESKGQGLLGDFPSVRFTQ